ncbi:GGDEF domain-containing protein [Shewanella surugensis]|uniref:diguanylate cyclase n=1 Tax=Shewanella surugensis TaxID=212020 RepID=A0ABT0LFY0_9GAMM|nr:GGDEF domain-containing protein [Shewanella surugensis]MCL1126617.1 GGDEF domain-containing protein [Shewanella surugensis]
MLLTITALTLTQWYQTNLKTWADIISPLPYWLLMITALIALQFNRSRLAFLAVLFVAYYALHQNAFFDWSLDHISDKPILIAGTLIISLFAVVKDRGILSSHGVIRLVSISICLSLGFFWFWMLNQYEKQITSVLTVALKPQFQLLIPLIICSLLVSMNAIRHTNLVNSAIFISLAIWIMHYYQPQWLPLSVLLSVLSIVYLITILVDSYFLAYRDELTGLPSRRALFNLSLSLGRKYSVAMLDIDHFKKFNDTYGHDVGDQVLKLVASKLLNVSGGGKVFRYGGEEFTIIFPRKNIHFVIPHLEAVRQAIQDYSIVLRDEKRKTQTKATRKTRSTKKHKTVNVTISIGSAERIAGESFTQALKRADQALYKAKKKGRNQVCR